MFSKEKEDMLKSDDDLLDVFVDTDCAGCGQNRRSTSGGGIVYHGHVFKHWSVTQTTLSLSSDESELQSSRRASPWA